jgi:predicted phosphodiesterase
VASVKAASGSAADLRQTSPDLVFHGGDLADAGSSPVEIVDRIRELGWIGVRGNTDEMLALPESLRAFAAGKPALRPLFDAIEEMAAVTRERLGPERLSWLRDQPLVRTHGSMALMHARPDTSWLAPAQDASDAELESVYGRLERQIAVYGHIHRPFVRRLPGRIVANCGSVGLPHDGDRRAAYLLVDEGGPAIRRVDYDVTREIDALSRSGLPHARWVARILESASPQMP